MSYKLDCRHPTESKLDPNGETQYTGSTFFRRSYELKYFCLVPPPKTETVRMGYILYRPNETPKESVLPLDWNRIEDRLPQNTVTDVTAFVQNVQVRHSTRASYNGHLGNEQVYQIDSSQQKGKVLIINNYFRGRVEEREGSEVDVRNMQTLWEGLGFEVVTERNLTAQQMLEICRRFATDCMNLSVVVVIIMTHGGKRNDGKEFFSGEDDGKVLLEDLLALFGPNTSPHLCDIPKVFLFQACRGLLQDRKREHRDAQGIEEHFYAQRADMLIAFPTQPGYTAMRNTVEGSWLMNAVTHIFMEHSHDTHLLDMLTMVNEAVSRKISRNQEIQISSQESYLRRKLFLFPGWPNHR